MIRDTFQPELDEFIGDMESYATGAYLKDDERDAWFEPFDAAAIPELRDVIERYLDALDALVAQEDAATEETLLAAVDAVTAELNRLNDEHDGAMLETDERDTLVPLIMRAAHAAGLDEEHKDLPERDF
ncbi:hypothetical protein [uncultured Corynebacterium sp.]|uniref:hypothetical protein n=1 Tax=uncultured Corynebacterium sp. TaxID=159447 RepID=UPI0025F7D4D7|nr:hypothetical protein [uncultured Corynebacterium sp.]